MWILWIFLGVALLDALILVVVRETQFWLERRRYRFARK